MERPFANLSYVERFRMELNLAEIALPEAELPAGYRWVPWVDALIDRHAAVKFASFRSELDARVFPCLGEPHGCRQLMSQIVQQKTFLPATTWLVTRQTVNSKNKEQCFDCATIQGLRKNWELGAIQNVGVIPTNRGLGLGRALVLKSLHGFRKAGLQRVMLEVTAENSAAVTLYSSLGFRILKTVCNVLDGGSPLKAHS